MQKRSAGFMFYPSLCVFVYACLRKDHIVLFLCCLDWMMSNFHHSTTLRDCEELFGTE